MVEGNGLENRRSREATVGSNPTLSAKFEVRGHFIYRVAFLLC